MIYHITRITMAIMMRLSIQRQGIVKNTQGLSQPRHGGTGVVGTAVVRLEVIVAGSEGVPVMVGVWLIEVLVAGFVIV